MGKKAGHVYGMHQTDILSPRPAQWRLLSALMSAPHPKGDFTFSHSQEQGRGEEGWNKRGEYYFLGTFIHGAILDTLCTNENDTKYIYHECRYYAFPSTVADKDWVPCPRSIFSSLHTLNHRTPINNLILQQTICLQRAWGLSSSLNPNPLYLRNESKVTGA